MRTAAGSIVHVNRGPLPFRLNLNPVKEKRDAVVGVPLNLTQILKPGQLLVLLRM